MKLRDPVNPKKMIIARTVPMEMFLKILDHLETTHPEFEKVLILQESTVGQTNGLSCYRIITVPEGMLRFGDLTPDFHREIQKEQPSMFVITTKVLYVPGYDDWFELGKSSGAADICMVSYYTGWRWIRLDHNDVTLDEKEIVKLSAEDVKTRFADSLYYDNVEAHIEAQWKDIIYPLIKNYDFSSVLELAPGHGRNTQKLMEISTEIVLVDANRSCIDFCRGRFKDYRGPCRLYYYVNDGQSLNQTPSASISFVYSWDSMVHFDKLLVHRYLKEFQRVLKPRGRGFIHHSNYGNLVENAQYSLRMNPHGRSNMTKELFRQYCHDIGLMVVEQKIIDWGVKALDCLSVFMKN